MKWKDSYDTSKINGDPEEDFLDEEAPSFWKKMSRFSQNLFGKTKNPIVWVGAGLFVVIVVLVLYLPGARKGTDTHRVLALEERLRLLEDKVAKLEGIGEGLSGFAEQSKEFGRFRDRFDRMEAAISLRMDYLAKELNAIQKGAPGLKTDTTATRKDIETSKKSPKPQYHQVRAGDTLYSISRRYGLKVEELLRLNNFTYGTVIHPGQKLLVGPVPNR